MEVDPRVAPLNRPWNGRIWVTADKGSWTLDLGIKGDYLFAKNRDTGGALPRIAPYHIVIIRSTWTVMKAPSSSATLRQPEFHCVDSLDPPLLARGLQNRDAWVTDQGERPFVISEQSIVEDFPPKFAGFARKDIAESKA